jgi:hypothetical protein
MIQSYLGRPARRLRSTGYVPPESWRAALREGKYLKAVVEPSLIRGLLEDVASPQATPDALRAFYALLTAELLLGGVQGLSKRVEFSGPDAPLIP